MLALSQPRPSEPLGDVGDIAPRVLDVEAIRPIRLESNGNSVLLDTGSR
jgi:hypothetical protein